MKLAYNNIKLLSPTDSFLAERRKTPYFGNNWHYHNEIELLLIIKGQGVRIVGDNMSHFGDNQLVLLGSNLPHLFRNEDDETKEVDYIVIKFLYSLCDISIFKIPELKTVNNLLKRSARGVLFKSEAVKNVKRKLIQLSKSQGVDKITNLIEVLGNLSKQEDFDYLASESYNIGLASKDKERTQVVIDFITQNYSENIRLEDLASLIHMTTNSFVDISRKTQEIQPLILFVNLELIRHVNFINSDQKISQICYSTGFNSVSTFNRIFKMIKGLSASNFRLNYQNYLK